MNMGLVESRRRFIKGASMAALGAAAMGTCAAHADTASNETATDVDQITWDEEYDVVVVGAGLAGLTSAVTVAKEGDGATVLLLEKSPDERGGGNSKYAAGLSLCPLEEDLPQFIQYLKSLRGEYTGTPDDYIESYARGLSEIVPFLLELGVPEEDLNIKADGVPEWVENPDALPYTRLFSFKSDNADGMTHCTIFMLDQVKNHFSDVITEKTESPLVALVQDPATKTVLGCIYENEGTQYYVKANKGVIMCTGGFENDPVMRQDYINLPVAHPIAGAYNTGDGHRICMKAGADLWHMDNIGGTWTNGIKLDDSEMLICAGLKKDQGITVGVNGRRFYQDWDGLLMYESGVVGGDLSLVYGCRHGVQNFGGDFRTLPMPTTTWFVFDSVGLDHGAYMGTDGGNLLTQKDPVEGNTQDPVADGYAYVADTIEELAEQMGVPAEELVRTVDQWNECCANGEDIYFHRPSGRLTPITEPPFYGLKCVPEFLCTNGGPRRSAKGEIIDAEGLPIPHLYSAGEFGGSTASKHENCSNLGECYAFGIISGRNVLAAE